jgi:hypothetical protein
MQARNASYAARLLTLMETSREINIFLLTQFYTVLGLIFLDFLCLRIKIKAIDSVAQCERVVMAPVFLRLGHSMEVSDKFQDPAVLSPG